jgi:hypothetical protein
MGTNMLQSEEVNNDGEVIDSMGLSERRLREGKRRMELKKREAEK